VARVELAVPATALRAAARLTSCRRQDGHDDGYGRDGTHEVEGEAAAPNLVDEGEERARDDQRAHPPERDERCSP
jgi:hypothetical protein